MESIAPPPTLLYSDTQVTKNTQEYRYTRVPSSSEALLTNLPVCYGDCNTPTNLVYIGTDHLIIYAEHTRSSEGK